MAGLLQPLHPTSATKGLHCKTSFLAGLGVTLTCSWVTAHMCYSPVLAPTSQCFHGTSCRVPENPVPSHQQQLNHVPRHSELVPRATSPGDTFKLCRDVSLGRKLCTGSRGFGHVLEPLWQLHQGRASFSIFQISLPEANTHPGAYMELISQNFWQRGDCGVGRE